MLQETQFELLQKEHGRSKVTAAQGDYIAKRLKVIIRERKISSLEDQKFYFLKFAQEFKKENNTGKDLSEIKTTTFYDFLKKHKIVPYSKLGKSGKDSRRNGLPIADNSHMETTDVIHSTDLSHNEVNDLELQQFSTEQLNEMKARHEEEKQKLEEQLFFVQKVSQEIDWKEVDSYIHFCDVNLGWSNVQNQENFEDSVINYGDIYRGHNFQMDSEF